MKILDKNKEIAFEWYCIGYREAESHYEDDDFLITDNGLKQEFEMEWEYQKEREE